MSTFTFAVALIAWGVIVMLTLLAIDAVIYYKEQSRDLSVRLLEIGVDPRLFMEE